MLRGLFRATLAERSGLVGRWQDVSGRLETLVARAGQVQGSRVYDGASRRQEVGVWPLLLRSYHSGRKEGGAGPKDGAVWKLPKARDKGRGAAIARTKEIDRLGEAKDVQGLLRFASEHVQDFGYRNCGAWLSRWARQEEEDLRGEAPAEVVSVMKRALQLLRGGEGVDAFFVSNLMNSLSKLEYGGDWRRLRDEVLGTVSGWCEEAGFGDFNAHDIANLVNGFAKMDYHPGAVLLKSLADECLGRGLGEFKPQAVANLINGFAKLEHDPGPMLLTAVADECLRRGLGGFKPQHIANVINGFAKFGHYPGEAVLQIAAALCLGRRFAGFIPQDLANVVHGLAVLRHHPDDAFLQQLCTACGERRFAGFNGQDVSNTLYALALLRHRPDEAWMGGFLLRCREVGWRNMAMQNLCLTLWAMEVLELRLDGGLVEALTARLRAAGKEGPRDVMMTCGAVRQVLYLQRQAGADEALRQLTVATEAAWAGVKHLAEAPTRSTLQREVGKMLREEGYEVKEEVLLSDERLSVDFMVGRRGGGGGGAVALEVDGPPHYFSNRPREATGEAVVKWRQLDRAVERGEVDAWVSVPWWAVYEDESEGRRRDSEIREDLRRLVEGALSGGSGAGVDVKERKDGGRGQEKAGGKTGRQGGARGR